MNKRSDLSASPLRTGARFPPEREGYKSRAPAPPGGRLPLPCRPVPGHAPAYSGSGSRFRSVPAFLPHREGSVFPVRSKPGYGHRAVCRCRSRPVRRGPRRSTGGGSSPADSGGSRPLSEPLHSLSRSSRRRTGGFRVRLLHPADSGTPLIRAISVLKEGAFPVPTCPQRIFPAAVLSGRSLPPLPE